MMSLVRTVLEKIAYAREKRKYDEQRKITDTMVADLDAIIANMKRARDRERNETRRALDASYIHPTKWRDAG